MSTVKIVGPIIPNLPWQDRPVGCEDVVWRHSANPIIGWNPTRRSARVFNSSVLPHESGFVGIFRADHRNIQPHLHVGWSVDGLDWEIDDTEIQWKDASGQPFQPRYAYDPRLVLVEGTYYIV